MAQNMMTQHGDTGSAGFSRSQSKRTRRSSGKRATILVIDNEASIVKLLAQVLDAAGYEVLTASDARTGLAMSRRIHPTLVLTDYMMPELNGAQLVRELRRQRATRDIPAVLMSSTRPSHDELRDTPFLAKPFDLESVLEIVARHVASPTDTPRL